MADIALLRKLHWLSSNNRESLFKAESYVCFHCLDGGKVSKIHEWIDDEATAVCPLCGIDSLLPPSFTLEGEKITMTTDLLKDMSHFWFGAPITWKEHEMSETIKKGVEELQKRSYDLALEKGFWSDDDKAKATFEKAPTFVPEKLMLMVTELAEAMEDYRAGKDLKAVTYREDGKPEGFPTELADVVIRALDLAEALNIPLAEVIEAKHRYNTTRPYKHGKTC